jgi:hypothetical protein
VVFELWHREYLDCRPTSAMAPASARISAAS